MALLIQVKAFQCIYVREYSNTYEPKVTQFISTKRFQPPYPVLFAFFFGDSSAPIIMTPAMLTARNTKETLRVNRKEPVKSMTQTKETKDTKHITVTIGYVCA